MIRFNDFLQRIIEVSSSDPDDARRRMSLNILALGLALILIVAIVVSLFFLSQPGVILILGGSIFMLVGLIGVYHTNRHLSGGFAANLFLLLLILVISFSDSPGELADGRSLFVFIVPITMASLILRPNAAFFFAFISSAIISTFSIAINQLPNWPAILGYFLVALISWMSSNSLENALRELRITNTNLDRIVSERTQALSDALTRERIEARRNQAILNSIADGVLVFNAEDVAILANPALSQLTETPLQNLIGNKLNDFMRTNQLSPKNQEAILEMIRVSRKNMPSFHIEWGEKTLSASIARVQDTTGDDIGTVAVLRDITQETELEKMKDAFVAIVSHELRTPLNAIMGHVEMLMETIYGPLNEEQFSITERVMVNSRRLLTMVDDLLDEAQIRAGRLSINPQAFKISSLLDNLHTAMDGVIAEKSLNLTEEIDPAIPEMITGDLSRLQQILTNLVNNAIKFTEKGGIHIRLLRVDADHWKMEVADTGAGIPENEIVHIFETFRQVGNLTTRKHGGVGIGLSIVRQLVDLMGGKVDVISKVGHGSLFSVTLPLNIN